MAKFEGSYVGDFDQFLEILNDEILSGSMSASFEDSSEFEMNDVRCAVRVYERYSYSGGNRLSASITAVCHDNDIEVSAITTGGSSALMFKINTLGEDSFLDKVAEAIETAGKEC